MAAKMGGAVDPASDPQARLVAEVGRAARPEERRQPQPLRRQLPLLPPERPQDDQRLRPPRRARSSSPAALFDKLDDEAELAGVLGHEIGHVINRHAAEHMATGRLGQMLTDGRRRRRQRPRRRRPQRPDGRRDGQPDDPAQVQPRATSPRPTATACSYMAQAGYDPSAMLDVMKILKEASQGNRQPEILATHPLPETRLEEIKALLAQDYPDGIPPTLTKGRSLRSLGTVSPAT